MKNDQPQNMEQPKHTAIIIDDEPNAVIVLQKLLERHCPLVHVIATATSSLQGLKKIKEMHPSIVFLDIEMPQMNGFQLLTELDDTSFHLVFTTAYDQFAVKAFKFNALDYLLKPIDPTELKQAIKKADEKHEFLPQQLQHLAELLEHRENENISVRIALPHAKGYKFISVTDILYCVSESNYTLLHLANEPTFTVCKTLGEIEEILPSSMFLRVHRSYVVNTKKIKEMIKSDGGFLVMENNAEIPVSRNKKDEIGELLKVR
jgi:two-component system LytT family response regulator